MLILFFVRNVLLKDILCALNVLDIIDKTSHYRPSITVDILAMFLMLYIYMFVVYLHIIRGRTFPVKHLFLTSD